MLSVGTLVVGDVACHLGAHGAGCSVPSYGTGRVGRGLTKGGGVLLGRMTAYYLVEESQGVTMMRI